MVCPRAILPYGEARFESTPRSAASHQDPPRLTKMFHVKHPFSSLSDNEPSMLGEASDTDTERRPRAPVHTCARTPTRGPHVRAPLLDPARPRARAGHPAKDVRHQVRRRASGRDGDPATVGIRDVSRETSVPPIWLHAERRRGRFAETHCAELVSRDYGTEAFRRISLCGIALSKSVLQKRFAKAFYGDVSRGRLLNHFAESRSEALRFAESFGTVS